MPRGPESVVSRLSPAELEDLRDRTVAAVRHGGAVAVGVCGVEPLVEARAVIERRRDAGLHAQMAFTYRNPVRSTEPTRALPSARTAVVAALPYPAQRIPTPSTPAAAVARYAAGDAYGELRAALGAGAAVLRGAGHKGVVLADDNALVDRAMAYRAGLGWLGKNTNLLVPGVGSWVVLGSVLTDADLPHTAPHRGGGPAASGGSPGSCGTCRRCLDGCPTGAIVAPGVLDATRCLSWLLQAEGSFPRAHRAALGVRIYGCDDCQEVCPPNRRAPDVPVHGDPGQWVQLRWMLEAGDEELLARLGTWYVPRRNPRWLRRNALVVLGNTGARHDADVLAPLRAHLRGPDQLLVEHAAWAARRLGRDDLLEEPGVAEHPEVRAEKARPHPGSASAVVFGETGGR